MHNQFYAKEDIKSLTGLKACWSELLEISLMPNSIRSLKKMREIFRISVF
jgi:hypothetical protein